VKLGKLHIEGHVLVTVSAWLSRIVTVLAQLYSIRILIDYLGVNQYAVFALLTGLAGWFMLADCGTGVSVQNHISERRAHNQSCDELIAMGGLLAILFSVLTIFALFFISPYVAPVLLKQFSFLSIDEKERLFFLSGALSIATGIGGVSYKIWYGLQKGYLSNFVPAVAAVMSVIMLMLLKDVSNESRLYFSLAVFMAPTALLPLLVLVLQVRRNIKSLGASYGILAKLIIKRALHFWIFSLLAAGVLQVDYIVIAQLLSSYDITVYNIATKVFVLVFFFYNALLFALWPVIAESIAKGEWRAVWRNTKQSIIFGTAAMFIGTMLLVWLMPVAVGVLAPKEAIIIPVGFILLLGVYQVIRVWTDTFAMLLQSMNAMTPFWILVPFQALASVGLQWVLVSHYGIYGAIWGLIGSFLLTVAWGLPLAVKRNYQRRMRKLNEY
jgi:O-antigen/teichoic acid export membrane protein